MAIATVNPATGETLREFEPYDPAEVERRLALAARGFGHWRRTSFADRAAAMHRLADLLDAEAESTGRVMTTEMGKTLEQSIFEVRKCANGCRWYADHAESLLADEPAPEAKAKHGAYATYQPMGAVLA